MDNGDSNDLEAESSVIKDDHKMKEEDIRECEKVLLSKEEENKKEK